MISYELIESIEDLQSIKNDWTSLQEKSPHTPFQDWTWHYSWWKNVGGSLNQKQFMMTAWENSKLKLIVPACVSNDGDVLQWSAGEVSDYCDVISTKEDITLVQEAMNRMFSKFSGTHLRMKQIRADSLAYDEMSKISTVSVCDDFVCPVLFIDEHDHDKWLTMIDRKKIADSNRQRRRLNEIGQVTFKEVNDKNEVLTSISQIISDKKLWLERRGAKNILCSNDGEGFLVDALPAMLEAGYVHITSLHCGGAPISNYISFIHDGRYYYYLGAWNYDWKNYSPGTLHLLDLIEYATHNGFKEFDLLRGEEEYKNKFSTDAVTLVRFELDKSRRSSLLKRISNKFSMIVH